MIAGYFFDLRIYFCIYIVYVYNRIGENQLSPTKFNPPFAGNAICSCVSDDRYCAEHLWHLHLLIIMN